MAVKTAGPASKELIQEQTQISQGTILYFPDYVVGGGWSVQLVLGNLDPDHSARVDVETYDQQGQRVSRFFNSGTLIDLPAYASRVLKSAGTGAIRRGWIIVRSQGGSVKGLLTYRDAASGIEVGVAPVVLGDRFALFVEESSEIGTGLAIFKPDAAPEIEFRIRDEAGNDPIESVLTFQGFQQRAWTLPEWFQGIDTAFLGDFRGTLFLRSKDGSSFAPLGLRFGKRQASLSAVPVIPFLPTQSTASPLYFADYVDGGGWSVQLVLGNLDPNQNARVEVEVYDQQGQPVRGLFDSGTRFELPAQGSRILRSAGRTQIGRGWVKVKTDRASVRGLLVYREAETGIEVSVAPIEPRDHFALFVEESSEIGTGLALFKPETAPGIELRIRGEAGQDPIGKALAFDNFQQQALTLPEWFRGIDTTFLRDFRGLLFLRSKDGSSFAPLGLRFGKQKGSLSAVPVIPILGEADSENRRPALSGSLPSVAIEVGQTVTITDDLGQYFTDPDGDPLTYTVRTSDQGIVAEQLSGSTVMVAGVARGNTLVHVTATDPYEYKNWQSFRVIVVQQDDHDCVQGSETPVDWNSVVSGVLTVGDEDCFAITVPQNNPSHRLTVLSTAEYFPRVRLDVDPWGTLYDRNYLQRDDNNDRNASTHHFQVTDTAARPGRNYYIRVGSDAGPLASGHYRIVVDDHGNLSDAATEIQTSSDGEYLPVTGYLYNGGDYDWFVFVVPSATTITVGTAGSTNTSGSLWDSRANPLGHAHDGGDGGNFRISRDLEPGTYYVSVRPGDVGPYELRFW